MTSNKDEDTGGDAANLIAWGLENKGYEVEFHPFVLSHKVGNINYIILHGDKFFSKNTTKEIIWDYGEQGCFNFVSEGHLHSRIQKLSVAQRNKFQLITDDAVDHRRQFLPSFFTGNSFSEELGFSTNPGFLLIEDNGHGYPDVFDFS